MPAFVMRRAFLLLVAAISSHSWTFLRSPKPSVACGKLGGSRLNGVNFLCEQRAPTFFRASSRANLASALALYAYADSENERSTKSTQDYKGLFLIGGLGGAGGHIGRRVAADGYRVIGTARHPQKKKAPDGIELIQFTDTLKVLKECTHLLITAPPDPKIGDPFLAMYATALLSKDTCKHLQWIGLMSSTGVYGDRKGGIVDEATEPVPTSDRSTRRLAAENGWRRIATSLNVPLDIFRCGGIYADGAYNSTFELLRAGTARRIHSPGHSFPRVHMADVARAVAIAAEQSPAQRRPTADTHRPVNGDSAASAHPHVHTCKNGGTGGCNNKAHGSHDTESKGCKHDHGTHECNSKAHGSKNAESRAEGAGSPRSESNPEPPAGCMVRVLNLVDDSLSTPSSEVVAYCADLLGIEPPTEIPLEVAWETMSPLAQSFWAENTKVRNDRTKVALGIEKLLFPTYREGMHALLQEEIRAGRRSALHSHEG